MTGDGKNGRLYWPLWLIAAGLVIAGIAGYLIGGSW